MKQRTLAFLIALTLLIPCIFGIPTAVSAEGETATTPSGIWDGSADTSWFNEDSETKEATLTTPQQLAGMTQLNKLGKKFEGWTIRLGANLFMNAGNAEDWQTAAPANEWRPIRNFMGTFDGQGYSISGLYLNNPSEEGTALFAFLNGATIRNLGITNSLFLGTYEVASVAGYSTGSSRIENVYSDAILVTNSGTDAGARSGGILGVASAGNTVLSACWFDGINMADGTADNKATRVGGLVGKVSGTVSLEDCLFTGSLTGHSQIGGLIGAVEGSGSPTMTRCLMLGEITSNRPNAENGVFAGQFVGILFASLTATVNQCYGLDSYAVNYLSDKANTSNKTAYSSTNNSGKLIGTEGTDYGRFSLADLTGENAKSKLTAFDFGTVWTVMPNGTPVLRALAAARRTPALYGFQNTAVSEANTYSIRFVSTLNSIPERAGTTITVTTSNGTYDLSKEATCVFTSLLADDSGKMTAKTSYALGGRYLMALTVENIPTSEGRLTFTVTPWVEEAGVRYTGESVQVIFDAGTPQATEN